MTYFLMILLAAGIVAADQFTKYLTVMHIAPVAQESAELTELYWGRLSQAYRFDLSMYDDLPHKIDVIPNVFSLRHIHNDGGAWGIFDGAMWLFALIFVLFAIGIIWEFSKKRMPFTTFERFCIVAVFAGGLGNMIDRLRLGFVVDMISAEFINFPIFNVADCFITCGCIALLVHLVFFNKKFWKEEKK